MSRPLLSIALCVAVAAVLGGAGPVAPEDRKQIPEIELKTLILKQIARYVSWPDEAFATPEAPLVIGIVGDEELADLFNRVAGGTRVQKRTIVVRSLPPLRFDDDDDDADRAAAEDAFRGRLRACQFVFLANAERRSYSRLLEHVDGHPVLTVSDIKGFATGNGMVQLKLNRRKYFDLLVNRTMLERARLRADAQLLDLAEIVTSRTPPPAIPGREKAAREP